MKHWTVERHDHVEVWTYRNPPMNYFVVLRVRWDEWPDDPAEQAEFIAAHLRPGEAEAEAFLTRLD